MSKIAVLELDRDRLKKSIDRMEDKLKQIDDCAGEGIDPALVTTLIESKGKAEVLLAQKETELRLERENNKLREFGSVKKNSSEVAKLSIGGSLRSSVLDKNSTNDKKMKEIVNAIFNSEKDAAKRADRLLEQGFIVQRKEKA